MRRPHVRCAREERRVQLSGEGVHESGVGGGRGGRRLLGLANFGVTFSKLESDGLRHVRVKTHSLLQILLGSLSTRTRAECDEAHGRGSLAILAGHLEQRALIALVSPEEQVQFPRLGVHRQAAHEQCPHLLLFSCCCVDGVHALGQCVAVIHGHAGHRGEAMPWSL